MGDGGFGGLGAGGAATLAVSAALIVAGGEAGAAAGTALALCIPLAGAARAALSASKPGRRGGPADILGAPRVKAALAGLGLSVAALAAALCLGSPAWRLAAAAAVATTGWLAASSWIGARSALVGDGELDSWMEADRGARADAGRARREAGRISAEIAEPKADAPIPRRRRL